MQFDEKVLTALEVLTDAAENDFELFRICTLVRDLIAPPVAEQVDENCQCFDGAIYTKQKCGHYQHTFGVHVAVWRYYNGNIPEGYEIHHDNLDKSDNTISNLILLKNIEHRRLHMALHGEEMRSARQTVTRICINCGKEFSCLNYKNRSFCSDKCRIYYRNHHRPKVRKTCAFCCKEFLCCYTHSKKQKCCSSSCAQKYKNQQRKAKTESTQISLFDDNTDGENSQ